MTQEVRTTGRAGRTRPERPLISIVAPCYNEAATVRIFIETITELLSGADFDFELVMVEDGSTDRTRAKLTRLADEHAELTLVAFSRNFGKEAALSAGLDHAQGDAVIVMDVDLQDPPELITAFVECWRDGYDVVYGVRSDRREDTAAKRVSAEGFYRIFNKLSGVRIPENTGDYRLLDRRVVEAVKALPERSRFMKGLFAWVGYRSIGVPYARPARAAGETKFSFWRLWNFALDGIVSFSTAPLRIWSYVGVVVAFFSFLYASFIIVHTLMTGRDAPGYASLLVVMLFFGSLQLISVGVLGEYISRLFVEVKQRPLYVVDEIYKGAGAADGCRLPEIQVQSEDRRTA